MTSDVSPQVDRRARTDLALYLGLTFALSWGLLLVAGVVGGSVRDPNVLFVVGTAGPTIAALALWLAGRRRTRTSAGAVRTAGRWLPPALLLGIAPGVVAAASTPLLGGPSTDLDAAARFVDGVGGPAAAIAFLLVAGPLAEEFGWRGYAQPRLRRALSPVGTAVVLGVVWAVWHVPLFLLDGTAQAAMGWATPRTALYLIAFVPLSYTFWYVSERLAGGVAAAVVLHLATNIGLSLLAPDSATASLVTTVTTTALAALLYRRERRRTTPHVIDRRATPTRQ